MSDLFTMQGTWLYLPAAFILGALHALEPGHGKSLMAGFIVANRGTSLQAILLGASAALSHSLVVWLVVSIGLALGEALPLERFHRWFELAGSIGMAVMLAIMLRAWSQAARRGSQSHDHHHQHGHDHDHHHGHHHDQGQRPDTTGPHAADRPLGAWSIAWFGLTAGLNPCPGAVVVLLLCLKAGNIALGLATVAAFSIGLAAVLILVGVAAAWGIARLSRRPDADRALAARLQLASVLLVGVLTGYAFLHVSTHFL